MLSSTIALGGGWNANSSSRIGAFSLTSRVRQLDLLGGIFSIELLAPMGRPSGPSRRVS